MPPAAPMVCQLYITVIQCNACRLYDSLVAQSFYATATCCLPPLWWASCILLSYSPMPAGCIISWLYSHLMPMPHAAGCPHGLLAVDYCDTVQCLLVVSFPGCTAYANATCRRPPLWCAGGIILSYSPMAAACMIS